MKKEYLIKTILNIFIIIGCIVVSALCYSKVSILSGVLWTITAIIWSMTLENEITKRKNKEYIDFLEFNLYNCLCILRIQEGELNAEQEQDNGSKEHKSK